MLHYTPLLPEVRGLELSRSTPVGVVRAIAARITCTNAHQDQVPKLPALIGVLTQSSLDHEAALLVDPERTRVVIQDRQVYPVQSEVAEGVSQHQAHRLLTVTFRLVFRLADKDAQIAVA